MPRLQRFNVKAMLVNPDLRRKLIVEGTRAAQAREGVEVSVKEAESSYYVVTEAERAAFFSLIPFRTDAGENDGRHVEFVKTLHDFHSATRVDVALRDFGTIDDAPLSYSRLALVGPIFRKYAALFPAKGETKIGHQTFNDERFVRHWWEVRADERGPNRKWVPFAKGGKFSRFYSDVYLVVRWDTEAHTVYATRKSNFNVLLTSSASDYLHREGLTWPRRTNKGFNIRRMPPGCVFGDKGPALFPSRQTTQWYLSGILNSALAEFLMGTLTSYSWESGVVQKLPIPPGKEDRRISAASEILHDKKRDWDSGNEISTNFQSPWVLQTEAKGNYQGFSAALTFALEEETSLDAELRTIYSQLNDSVYQLYEVNTTLRGKMENAIGPRPPEIIWPQMEGKSVEQKRLEHVNRLLTYLMKRLVEADNDGLVCLQAVAQERPLLDRLREELHRSFPQQDPSILETEVVNELKKKVKGYRRAETLNEWLNDAFFEIHANLYQQRPLLWHLASSQTRSVPAFSVVVHAHKFDGDALAKLRSVHIRDRLAILRREAGQARQDNREEDRLEFLAAIEEVEAFDANLKLLQEGAHTGPEGGDRDYRILTPWKAESDRPQGWNPDLDDGIKVNIAPLARTGLLRIKGRFGEKDVED